MKRLIISMISILIIIGVLIAKEEIRAKDYRLINVSEQEVLNYFKTNEEQDKETSGMISPKLNKTGESAISYGDKLYITSEFSITIIDTISKERNKIEFDFFQPLELIVEDELLYVIGIYDELKDIVIDENNHFLYNKYECQVSIFDIETMTEIRYLRFNRGYYASSYIVGNTIFVVVHINRIVNEERNALIYPSFDDSKNGLITLNNSQIFLSPQSTPINSLMMIVRLELNENEAYPIGLIGVEGIEKISGSHFLIASTVYENDLGHTVVHHIDFKRSINYKGFVLLEGCLINFDSLEVINNFLHVGVVKYKEDLVEQYIYNIALDDLFVVSKINISHLSNIALILFKNSSAYVSTYNDNYFHILHLFSNKESKSYNLDFVGEQIVFGQDSFDIVGRKVNIKHIGNAICFASFNLLTNKITRKYIKNAPNVDFEGGYNPNATIYHEDKVYISYLSNGNQKIMVIKKGNQILLEKIVSVKDYCRRILIINNLLYAIGFEKVYEYNLDSYQIKNTYLIS